MKIHKFKNSIFLKVLSIFLIFSFLPTSILSPVSVHADKTGGHDNYRIVSYWTDNGSLSVTMETESNKFGASAEEKDIKTKTLNTSTSYLRWDKAFSVNTDEGGSGVGPFYGQIEELGEKSKSSMDDLGLIYTFPSYQRGTTGTFSNYNKDMERASEVSSTLGSSVNSLLDTIKGLINYKNNSDKSDPISDSITITRAIMPTAEGAKQILGTDYDIYYYDASKYSNYKGSYPVNAEGNIMDSSKIPGPIAIDENGNLMAYIVKHGEKPSSDDTGFVWAMPKGYLNPIDGKAITAENNYWGVMNPTSADKKGDATWITIFTLSEYANAKALYMNETSVSHAEADDNFIESTIYGIIFKVYANLLNILNLQTIPELIYNGGTRGGNSYEAGMMTSSWWSVVLKYHLIFQIVAWMMIIVAVAKTLIQINFSTVNPALRMTLMESLQKFVMVGFALALCIPLIRLLASFNNAIVDIFKTQAMDDGGNLGAMGLAGVIILLGYMGITFTLNCIYIMRAIMIAILTASAPLFIVSMAFSGPRQKGLFDNWLKEISANIFMQAVHAFAFAFLFDVMDSSKLLTRLVIYFSLLPIVDSFRQLIFGNAGGFAVSQGQKSAQTTGSFVEQKALGAAAGVANVGAGAITKKFGANLPQIGEINTNKDIGSAEGGSGSGGHSGGGTVGKGAAIGNISTAGKALKENAANTKGVKGALQRGAGHALSGAAKGMAMYKSTGGIMGNAVTRANLGDVEGSIKASKTYGDGITDTMGTVSEDISAMKTDHNARKYDESSSNLNEAQTAFDNAGSRAHSDYAAYQSRLASQKGEKNPLKKVGNAVGNIQARSNLSSEAKDLVKAESKYNKYTKKVGAQPVSVVEDGKGNLTYSAQGNVFNDSPKYSNPDANNNVIGVNEKYATNAAFAESEYFVNKDTGEMWRKEITQENGQNITSYKSDSGKESSSLPQNVTPAIYSNGRSNYGSNRTTISSDNNSLKKVFDNNLYNSQNAKSKEEANEKAKEQRKEDLNNQKNLQSSIDSLSKQVQTINSSMQSTNSNAGATG